MAGYDPHHFAALFAVEERHFWFSARNVALKSVIEPLIPRLPSGYRVLEIGCGTGNTLRVLKEACSDASLIVGMDLFAEGLHYARQRAKVPLVQGRIEQAPFTVRFDVVGMFDVLEHIEDDAAALKQVRELTKPGGLAVITVPAHMALWSRFDEESHHCRRYETEQFRSLLIGAGFTVEYLTPFMAALYPVARAVRWASGRTNALRRRFRGTEKSAVLGDLRIRPVINNIVGGLLRPERSVLRRRGHLPLGTSLLAVVCHG